MKQYLKNRLAMLTTVVEHFDGAPDAWSGHAPIVRNLDPVRATRDALRDGAEAQAAGDTTGHTRAKALARAAAADRLADLGNRVRPFARETADAPLLTAFDRAPTDWVKVAEADFVADAHHALSLVVPHLPALGEYGVTAETLADAREAVDAVPRLTAARDAVGVRGETATEGLGDLYPAVLPHLANLDDLVPALVADEAFVTGYRHARQIPGD